MSSSASTNNSRSMSDSPRKRGINEASPRRKSKPVVPSKKKVKMQVIWPASQLPVEIYEMIVSYLSRENIQNMRLVNREFEQNVSPYLFKRVVVPFKPELYSISKASPFPQSGKQALNGVTPPHGAVLLQDKGMRVFQGFGSHIRQFAMSFEFDEAALSRPPIKSDQEAVTTFWGIYRWPFKEYNRYRQLEGLEQTADETRTMANALRYIRDAKELGLSIDGGLGWLSGPDSTERSFKKPMVFGGPRCMPDEEPQQPQNSIITPNGSFSDDDYGMSTTQNQREALLERMLRDSGYEGSFLSRSLRTLAESEGPPPAHLFRDDNAFRFDGRQDTLNDALAAAGYVGTPLTNMRTFLNRREPYYNNPYADDDNVSAANFYARQYDGPLAALTQFQNSENFAVPLKPNDLTNAQKEMLLELEWAQRAFMQSWAIAVIDNKDTFGGIETLTIARLPGRHLPIIKRDDFWMSLTSLKKVSLAIIPDWREVTKLPTSFVQDTRLEPSRAATFAYEVIQHHIAKWDNIKSLHFEWICGGEDAVGQYARNRNILAAPFMPKSLDMVNTVIQPKILSLPHIQHMSLKNCWFSPHALLRFTNNHRDTLLSLSLDSVSLCAPLSNNAQPGPLHHAGYAGQIHNQNHHPHLPMHIGNVLNQPVNPMQAAAAVVAQNGLPAFANAIAPGANVIAHLAAPHPVQNHMQAVQAQPAPPAPTPAAPSSWRSDPRLCSWAHIIDELTPNETIAIKRFNPDTDFHLPPTPRPTSMKKMEFKSCGYVSLPLDYNQTILQPGNAAVIHPAPAEREGNIRRRNDIDCYMLKTSDASLGVIINYMDPIEALQLEHVFGLDMGWVGEGANEKIARAQADGVAAAGVGRFSGIIETSA